jgi:hypothetical protein
VKKLLPNGYCPSRPEIAHRDLTVRVLKAGFRALE